jgi:hypothetical protein
MNLYRNPVNRYSVHYRKKMLQPSCRVVRGGSDDDAGDAEEPVLLALYGRVPPEARAQANVA